MLSETFKDSDWTVNPKTNKWWLKSQNNKDLKCKMFNVIIIMDEKSNTSQDMLFFNTVEISVMQNVF